MHRTRLAWLSTLVIILGWVFTLADPGRAQAQACPPGHACLIVVEQPAPPPAAPPVTAPPPAGFVPGPGPAPVTLPPGYGAPEPQPVQTTRSRPQWRVIVPGAIMLGAGWVFNWLGAIPLGIGHSFGASGFNFERYFGWSFIPVIGPWVNAAAFEPDREPGSFAFHLVLGLVQGAGLLMAILGTVITEEVTVTRYALDAEGHELELMPLASPQLAGAAARLSF